MQTESYTYQTSANQHSSVVQENAYLKNIIEQIKQILEHKLYREESKINLCLNLLKENRY